jgi:hypothetical protein
MSSEAVVQLSRKARRALKAGKSPLGPGATLMAEILSRTGAITQSHLTRLTEDLLSRYGDPEDAVEALRRGEVGFSKLS